LLKNTIFTGRSVNIEYYSPLNNKWYSIKTIVFQPDYELACLFDITLGKLKDLELTQKNNDLIQLKKDKKLVEISEKRYKILVNSLGDVIYSCNLDGVITMVNKMFCQLTGKTEKKIIGTKITSYFNTENTNAAWSSAIKELIETKSPSYLEYEYVLSDGSTRFYQASLSPISDLNNNVVGFIGSNQDITRLKLNEQKMISLAYHDSLTNLPNKTLFLDRLKTAISISARNRVKIGVAFVDLDNFKRLNAVYGHDIGDRLLSNVAQKLVSCVRNYDTVARFSEDKFLVLFQHINHGSELFSVFERIRLALLEPLSIICILLVSLQA
jgi:polar amino acid transport system substrate-binding protein